MTATSETPEDLPPDNASHIAIYDALADALSAESTQETLGVDDLFQNVISRLRVLVPRELHLRGERGYLQEKLDACLASGLIERVGGDGESYRLTGASPQIRYPDGTVRDYRHGLEPATERLDADNAKLRQAQFDVTDHVPSLADAKGSPEFQALVTSMREHGYLRQFPIAEYPDGTVIDGRARIAAASIAGVSVKNLTMMSKQDKAFARRRDTPLHRVLLALDANHGRLHDEDRQRVYDFVSRTTGRGWPEIAIDLTLTRDWRLAVPAEYSPWFDVRLVRFRPDGEPRVQVTPDQKVMLRSLLESAGLTNWKIKDLKDHVPIEEARTKLSAGRKAGFAQAADLITGIEAMQRDRRARKLKLDREWGHIHTWLRENFGSLDDSSASRP
jgi:hypothetical protein